MVKFLLSIAAIGILFSLGVNAAVSTGWISTLPSFFYPTLLFVSFTTIIVYLYLYRITKAESFTLMFLLLMAVKLLASLGYAVVIVLKDKTGAVPNIIAFLAIYILCTAVETGFLYARNRARS